MALRHLLAACAASLLLVGCGGDDPGRTRADDRPSAPVTTGSGGAPPASAAAGAGPATAAPTASPSPQRTAAQASAGPGEPASAGAPATGDAGTTAAGAYTYDVSGTVTVGTPRPVDGTATLTVSEPTGDRQASVLEGDQGRTEQDVVARSDGRYLARLSIANPAFTKEFVPSSPVLLVPAPQTVGRSWSWRTTSTDGKTTAAVTARIARTETLTIGGRRTATVVVESTLRLTGDVTYTGRTSTWYAPAHRLGMKDRTQGEGTVSGFAFRTDLTSVLRSTRAA